MAVKEQKEHLAAAGAVRQVEMPADELASITGGLGLGTLNVTNKAALVTRYGQLVQLLKQNDVPDRDKRVQELHDVQAALHND